VCDARRESGEAGKTVGTRPRTSASWRRLRTLSGIEGDIGGFGAGSDFAWQLYPLIGADVSKHVTIGGGYRVLSMDYTTGNEGEQFKYDVVTQAIVIGAAFHF
jgi:hypothetical protein